MHIQLQDDYWKEHYLSYDFIFIIWLLLGLSSSEFREVHITLYTS